MAYSTNTKNLINMCLKPLKIRNPTSYISFGGQPLMLNVPCGHCADCKKSKRLEWHFRSYYEFESCVRNGGYIYFDTLTYAPEHVPHISRFIDVQEHNVSDFMCFDSTDWRNFLKNLRRQLQYHYKTVNFKYFLTSEYGTSKDGTHRPHYHILFFVNSKRIHPYAFSYLVSKCWPYGRTDGIKYKGKTYVDNHTYGYKFASGSNNDYLSVCSYVSKYVTKDSTFQSSINNRLLTLERKLDEDDFKKLKRSIDMFHRQSQGFGLSYLDTLTEQSYSDLFNTGLCKIIDKKKVICTIPIPLYYKRKLFYKSVKINDSNTWVLTPTGKEYIRKQLFNSVALLEKSYTEIFLNSSHEDKSIIQSLLGSRSFQDLAVYSTLYKGRLRDFEALSYMSLSQSSSLTDKEYNIFDWINSISEFTPLDPDITRVRETHIVDIPLSFGTLFDRLDTDVKSIDYSDFIKLFSFTQDSDPIFKDFDILLSFFEFIQKPNNTMKQKTFDFIEDLTKKLKLLYEN